VIERIKTQQLEIESAELRAQLGACKKENALLRQQFIAILQTNHSQPSPTTSPPHTVSYSDYQALVHKIDVLQKQLLESNDDRRTEAEARKVLINKLKNTKRIAKEWMNYRQNNPNPDAVLSSAAMPRDPELLSPVPPRLLGNILTKESVSRVDHNFSPTPQTGELPRQLAIPGNEYSDLGITTPNQPNISANISNLIPSSQQETMPMELGPVSGEEVHEAPIQPLLEDEDIPTIVSERPVKRRRVRKSQQRDEEIPLFDLSRVKREPTIWEKPSHRTDTLDLDEVGNAVNTPRREMRIMPPQLLQHYSSSLRNERSQSVPLKVHQIQTSYSPSILETTEIDDRYINIPRNPINHENRSQSQPPDNAGDSDDITSERAVLAPVNVNKRVLPKKEQASKSKVKKYGDAKTRQSAAIRIISEDGEFDRENDNHATTNTTEAKSRGEKSAAQLNSLLEQGNKSTPSRITRATLKQSKTPFKVPAVPKSTPQRKKIAAKQLLSPRHSQNATIPALRDAKVESLSLADFRINPAMNDGLSFAFQDAVYGNERRCLPGCTDARCCGPAMRTLASALKPTVPRPTNPSCAEDEILDDEQYTIKWYLGDKFNRQEVARMTTHDRAELLLEAQTKYVAEQYGRHRNVSDRRRTPPGFWDSDMPSTQEQEKHRRQTQKIERDLVGERYREAMKRGRWLFRDE
jgi:DNA repair protein endonuclease SAE2/CtIP